MDKDLEVKYNNLKEYLKSLGSVAVAFSSGVDSTFLLKVAHDVLGDKAIAITLNAVAFPEKETNDARDFCKSEGIKHIICGYNPLDIEGFADNPPDRCYICKKVIYSEIKKLAKENNVVMDGRDIGTAVLPNADLKIYLTASSRTRAMRRYKELVEKGEQCDVDAIEADIKDRDYRDMHREVSPLCQAEDAVLVDSSDMSIEQVVEKITGLVQ